MRSSIINFAFISLLALMLSACGMSAVHLVAKKTADKHSESKKAKAARASSCLHRLGGNYQVGRSPTFCALGAPESATLSSQYTEQTFDDRAGKEDEQIRYAQQIYVFVSENSVAYFKRRRPESTQEETTAWVDFVLSVAHQESIWSHFRYGDDGIFRFLRGDNLHGYGLMQIDDRSHQKFISSKKVYDLTHHLTYALDIAYTAYQKVEKSPCDDNHTVQEKYRSVYCMYNGGFGSKCRWMSSSRWKQNDINFWDKYSEQKYLAFLDVDAVTKQQEKLVAMMTEVGE